MVFTDYYKTLGIELTANEAAIKAAHRTMSKRFHPDVNAQDEFYEDRFKEVQEAYKVLSDPKTRRLYDKVYHRYSRQGVSAGNVIHIPDDAAGKPAYAWHPDYRQGPTGPLLSRKMSLLLGISIVMVSIATAGYFYGTSGRKIDFSKEDNYRYAEPAVLASAKTTPAMDTQPAMPVMDKQAVVISNRTAPSPLPVTSPVRPIAERLKPAKEPPPPVIAIVKKVPPIRPDLPKAVPQVAEVPLTPSANSSQVMTVKGAPVPADLQYGYVVVAVKRILRFRDGRPDETQMVNYVTRILPYGTLTTPAKAQAINAGQAQSSIAESAVAATSGDFTLSFSVIGGRLKTFKALPAAAASLKAEQQVIRL